MSNHIKLLTLAATFALVGIEGLYLLVATGAFVGAEGFFSGGLIVGLSFSSTVATWLYIKVCLVK